MQLWTSIVALLTGLGVFMVGIKSLRTTIAAIVTDRLSHTLSTRLSNRYMSASYGAVTAAIMHSSATVTAITINLVNARAIGLLTASAIILGANIGTTITGLTSAIGVQSLASALSVLVLVGVMIGSFAKSSRVHNISIATTSIGLILLGLSTMTSAFGDSTLNSMFGNVISMVSFPPLVVLLSMLVTAVLQSSSAMIAIVLSMVSSGVVELQYALFIVLGADAGTCITALIASAGGTLDARRTAWVQILFNLFGVIAFTAIVWLAGHSITILLSQINNAALSIALFHTFFNLSTALIALPLLKHFVKMIESLITDTTKSSYI